MHKNPDGPQQNHKKATLDVEVWVVSHGFAECVPLIWVKMSSLSKVVIKEEDDQIIL